MNQITLKTFFNLIIGVIVIITTSFILIFNITAVEIKEKDIYLQEEIIASLNSINRINGLINEIRKTDILIFSKINIEKAKKNRENFNDKLVKELNAYAQLNANANANDAKVFEKLNVTIEKYNDTLTFDMVDYEYSLSLILNILTLTDELSLINNGYVSDYINSNKQSLNDNAKYITMFSLVTLIMTMIFTMRMMRDINLRIKLINNGINRFVNLDIRTGELCYFIESKKFKNDEIGSIMINLKEFRVKIAEVLTLTRNSVNNNKIGVDRIGSSLSDNKNCMITQFDNMSQLVTAINELQCAAMEVASNINKSAGLKLKNHHNNVLKQKM